MNMSMKNMAMAEGPALPDVEVAEERGPSIAERVGEKIKGAGTWIQSRWEKFKTVAKEWKDDVVDTIKLNTIDKWKAATTLGVNNILIAKREREIAKTEAAEKLLNEERTETQLNSDREMALFDEKMTQYDDPDLVAVLSASKMDKKTQFDKKDVELGAKIDKSMGTREQAHAAINKYGERISEIKTDFTARLDGKIQKIEGKYDYAAKLENRGIIEKNITDITSGVKDAEGKLAQYQDALNTFKDKEVARSIKEKMSVMKEKLAGLKKTEAKLQKAKAKLDRNIGKIQKKTGKYKDMKVRYGLAPAEAATPEESQVSQVSSEEAADVVEVSESTVEIFRLNMEKIDAIEKRISEFIEKPQNFDEKKVEKDIVDATLKDLEGVKQDSVEAGLLWEIKEDFMDLKKDRMFVLNRVTLKVYKAALTNLALYKKIQQS